MRNHRMRFHNVTVIALPVRKLRHVWLITKTKEIREFNQNYLTLAAPHLCNRQTMVYLCFDWMVTALSGLCQAELSGPAHISSTSPAIHLFPPLPSAASARFTLTNVQEQAAPAGLREAGRGGMDWGGGGGGKLDLIDKCLRIALLAARSPSCFTCVLFVCVCACRLRIQMWVCVERLLSGLFFVRLPPGQLISIAH